MNPYLAKLRDETHHPQTLKTLKTYLSGRGPCEHN